MKSRNDAASSIDYTRSVTRVSWRQWEFDQQYGDVVRAQTARERAAQGLPEKVEVNW